MDDDGNPIDQADQHLSNGDGRHGKSGNTKTVKFMEGVPGVQQVTAQPLLWEVQKTIQHMCGWRSKGFPGSQPVSMRLDNINLLQNMPYKVSWKADGTRYMMLIDGKDRVFFADRDHCIFKVENLTFLDRKDPQTHLSGTLLDGVCYTDVTVIS